MLELKDIQYRPSTSEEPVLQGVDLLAHASQPVVIAGASGSGKTSLLSVLSVFNICLNPVVSIHRQHRDY